MKTLPTRDAVPIESTWKLEDIFATDAAWEKEFAALAARLPAAEAVRGTLGRSAPDLVSGLRVRDEFDQQVSRLAAYARMRSDEDTTRARYQALTDRVMTLATQLGTALSFYTPEILAIPPATLDSWLASDPDLHIYRHELADTTRARPHIRTAEVEALLASASEVATTPAKVFGMFDNADLTLPIITDAAGEAVQLTKGSYFACMQSQDRTLRQAAFEGMHSTFKAHQNTLAATFSAQVKRSIFYARQRGYPSTLAASLDPHNIPTDVYTNLIATVEQGLPALHRYLKLRQRVLGLDEQHLYDLEAPLVPEIDLNVPFAEARAQVIAAVAPLGPDYVTTLTKGLASRWIDVPENQGKRGGAYSFGVYGVHPFVLLNYQDRLSDVFTLAHELGHSLHSHYTQATQPYHYAHYTLFLAEIASTFNEALLTQYLLDTTDDKAVRAYILTQHLSRLRGTLFRQTMFADFEAQAHARAEAGEALTPELLCGIYSDLNQRYFGAGGTVVDELVAWEWSRIPHFYRSFYVYQYATGISASTALARNVLTEGQPAVDRYLNMLRSGSSAYSIDLLKAAGVDMTTPAPITATIQEFDNAVTELEGLL